jgi:MraZ protein
VEGDVRLAKINLIGTYQHSIDSKGRMAFPTKFREQLGLRFIVTIGLKGNLFVFSEGEWENFTDKIKNIPYENREIPDFLVGMAREVEPDGQGRILLPQNLRERAGLSKSATVRGVINHAEIWDTDRYNAHIGLITDDMLLTAFASFAF